MKLKFNTTFTVILLIYCFFIQNIYANKNDEYLLKPSGKYAVGFQDFHWLNTKICPDPNYDGKNKNDFSSENKNYCHEIMVRIYYPADNKSHHREDYYHALVETIQNDLKEIPGISNSKMLQIKRIKSFSVKNAKVVPNLKFPIIYFSPGLGSQVQMYENFITQLVSHGYIVIGINSSFINGDIELPNGHTVKFNTGETLNELFEISPNDFTFVFKRLLSSKKTSALFSAMDFDHIGALGQSLGGEIVAKLTHTHPEWFKAAATLDSGIDKYDDTLKKFKIPFMRVISANRTSEEPLFSAGLELEDNGFLVVISPSHQNYDYSYHMNFTDYSTLQYLPAEQIALSYFYINNRKTIFGKGDGQEITNSINHYLLEFFNTYLKDDVNTTLIKCVPLNKNTIIRCGNTTKR